MNRSELRALAEAARVGGEGADWCAVPGGIWCCNVGPCKHLPRLIVRDEHMTPENRTFIAAADPSTVLALLDRLDAAEALLRLVADESHYARSLLGDLWNEMESLYDAWKDAPNASMIREYVDAAEKAWMPQPESESTKALRFLLAPSTPKAES